jgi:S1-C subfamily serine protease
VPDIVAATRPSIVLIRATVESDDPAAGSLLVDATGTGFVIRSDGMIATAAHVIAGAWSVRVVLADGDVLSATVRGVDEATDLAVLAIDRDDLVPLEFGQTSAVRVGETVIALGHALDLGVEPTVSVGVLSAVERTITGSDGRTYDHLLQTDAAINVGDSGGPLVNSAGQVIGINTSRISSNDAEGVGFAICTDHALPMLVRLEGG